MDNVVLSQHREAGRWWEYEPYREVTLYLDAEGIQRRKVQELPSLGILSAPNPIHGPEDHTEDYDIKIQKIRDEKVARACDQLPRQKGLEIHIKSSARPYALLHTVSGYSFGRSAMMAEEIPPIAAHMGVPTVLLADYHSLTGAYEFDGMARRMGIRPLIGATISLPGMGDLVLVAKSKRGYRDLSRLITACHLEEPRLQPKGSLERLRQFSTDLICLSGGGTSYLNQLIAGDHLDEATKWLTQLKDLYGQQSVWIQIERSYLPYAERVNRKLQELGQDLHIGCVAGGPITLGRREHYAVQDVLACSEFLFDIEGVSGRKSHEDPISLRHLNAERYIKSSHEMHSIYQDCPELLENTLRIAEMCDDQILPGRTRLPQVVDQEDHVIKDLVLADAIQSRNPLDKKALRRIDLELDRIRRLGFSGHFLVAHDLCQWANRQGIHYSARGSVVDSVVAYHLGLSRIDAWEHQLHFDRFLPEDGTKRPDIDIDFEASRREDVRQYLVQRYGKDHVATVAAVGAYSTRGIIREVGKVMGLPDEAIRFLAKKLHAAVSPERLEAALDKRPELRSMNLSKERYRWVFRLAERLSDMPRNMRAHSSGVVISADPIADTVPVQHSGVECVPIIQWDKRSAKKCFDKFDLLFLRGQDVLSQSEEAIRAQELGFSVQSISHLDPEVFRAFRSGQLIGIPQSASPAMRQAHVRLRTEDLRDASLVQAGIRPGVGGAVKINELIARRRGKPYQFDHPDFEPILGSTYGIIVFQEQVDQLLQNFAGCSSGEAEDIRESIHKRRREDFAQSIKMDLLKRIVNRGYSQSTAEQVYDYIAGFNGYGFAQGHALAFADISIKCVWLQQNYPAEYFTALLNSQPAGYYGPATIANEARSRGIQILPPEIQDSSRISRVATAIAKDEPKIQIPSGAIRIGLEYILGLSDETLTRIENYRPEGTEVSFFDFTKEVRPNRDELETLVKVGFFESQYPNRRALLWAVPEAMEIAEASRKATLPMTFDDPRLAEIQDYTRAEKAVMERRFAQMNFEFHLMAFERERIWSKGGLSSQEANHTKPGTKAFVVGNPIRLRFPPTKSGRRVVFFDLEDETGLLNVTCFDSVYLRDGAAIVGSPYVTVQGVVQDRDGYPAFLARRVFPYRPVLYDDLKGSEALPLVTADFLAR